MNSYQLLQDAEKALIEKPYDKGHDIVHHAQVWANCVQIVLAEKLTDVKLDSLQVAAWWHDVDRGDHAHPRYVASAQRHALPAEDNKLIFAIIDSHSYDDKRSELLEAKVLFDADKVEYLNPLRWLRFNDAIAGGETSIAAGEQYCQLINARIKTVMASLYFPTAKKMLNRNIEQLIQINELGYLQPEFVQKLDWQLLASLLT